MNKAKHFIILGILQKLELILSTKEDDEFKKEDIIKDIDKLRSDIVTFVYEIEDNKWED